MKPISCLALAVLACAPFVSAAQAATSAALRDTRLLSSSTLESTSTAVNTAARQTTGPEAWGTQYFNSIDNAVGFTGVNSGSSPTAGLGNLQTGMAVFLDNFTAGSSQIRFMEVPIGNLTAANITARPLRVNVWLWETVNVANITTGGTSPVFAQIKDLGNGPTNPTAVFNFSSITLATGSLAVASLDFGTPFTLSPTNGTADLIGVSWNIQVDNGAGFVSVAGLNTTVIGGATTLAPLVGDNLFGPPPAGAYFRSANSTVDINGQFAGGSSRQVGNNSGVPFSLFIPEPTTLSLLAGVGIVALRRRSK
jgi:hypothetical protein